jgi:hypothetical protein
MSVDRRGDQIWKGWRALCVVVVLLAGTLLCAAPIEAQLKNLLNNALGRSREIESVEELKSEGGRAVFSVRYREVEDPAEVEISAGLLDEEAEPDGGRSV